MTFFLFFCTKPTVEKQAEKRRKTTEKEKKKFKDTQEKFHGKL